MRRFAVRIDAGIGRFLAVRGNWALRTEWEAPRHAWTLSNLALRYAEGTALMARTDVVLAPSGWVTARAAVESAARCLWLIEPPDHWEREARWLTFLYEGSRIGKRAELAGNDAMKAKAALIEQLADAVALKLPDGVVIPGVPSVQAILAGYGTDLSEFYVLASQYTHGAELATQASRVNLGMDASYGEHVQECDWYLPLWASWLAFRVTAVALIEERSGDPLPDDLQLIDAQVLAARDALRASFGGARQ